MCALGTAITHFSHRLGRDEGLDSMGFDRSDYLQELSATDYLKSDRSENERFASVRNVANSLLRKRFAKKRVGQLVNVDLVSEASLPIDAGFEERVQAKLIVDRLRISMPKKDFNILWKYAVFDQNAKATWKNSKSNFSYVWFVSHEIPRILRQAKAVLERPIYQ